MSFKDQDANAQILRNYTDFSSKSNQYFTTHLKRLLDEIFDEDECSGEALSKISAARGVELLKRKYRNISNLDIAYILILNTRGYKFRLISDRVFLCDENALYPDFEKFSPIKPKLSDSYEIKSAIVKSILDGLEKCSEELKEETIRSISEILERKTGILYTGKYLSINEWFELKEKEGSWISEDVFRFGDNNLTPWIIGNLLILQARGWYFQEIPDKFKGNEYIFVKK